MTMQRILKFFLLVVLLFSLQEGYSQTRLSVSPENSKGMDFNTVRALVIGISNYKNLPLEKQLEYAADDAMGFYRFLLSRPDIIQPQNIITFFNEEATDKTRIKTTLYNLIVKESEKNDLVILYFAGHGDVQNFSRGTEEGFLLLHDVSRDGDYMAPGNDVIEISDLQKYISLAPDGVKVLLITDACRSGKLASNQKAASRVLGALIQEWQDTYKLVSSQPNQLSYENRKWGGGHGVFSYYLLYGMKGLADVNNDQQIQFYELFDFVKKRVQEATNYNQIPKAKGDETVTLLPVDKEMEQTARRKFPEAGEDKQTAQKQFPERNKDQQSSEPEHEYPYLQWGANRSGGDYFYDVPPDKQHLINRFEQLTEKGVLVPEQVDDSRDTLPDMSIGEKIRYRGHEGNVFAADISLDGSFVATGGRDSVVKLWDAKNGRLKGRFPHQGVKALRFTPDGQHLVSGGWDNRVRVWDVDERRIVASRLAHSDDIESVSFSRDGRYMATGGRGRKIKVWNTNRWEVVASFPRRHAQEVHDLAFSRDGQSLLTAGEGGHILKRSAGEGSVLQKASLESPVHDLLLVGNSNQLLAATGKGDVVAFHPQELTLQRTFDLPLQSVESMAVDPRGHYLLAGGVDHRLLVWNLQENEPAASVTVPRGISRVALNAFREKSACAMYGGHVMLLDIKNILPPVSGNAYDMYRLIRSSKSLSHLWNRARGYYCSALQSYASDIIRPFINGKALLPDLEEIRRARTCLHYAARIYQGEDVISRRIKIKQQLLDIFETLKARRYHNLSGAAAKVQDIINEQPDAAYTHNTLSVIYRRLNELKKARQSGRMAARRIPDWTEPKANLGKACFKEGDYDKALDEFGRIVEIRPDLAKGYARRADVFAFLGNFSKAQKEYEKAMQRDSLNPETHHGLARLQMNTGRENEAEQLLRFSLEKHPGYRNNRFLLARLYHYRFVKYYRRRGKVREDLLREATEVLKQEKECYRADMIKADIFLTIYSLREELSDLKRNRMVEIFDVDGFKAFRQKAYHWFNSAMSHDPLSARVNAGIARCHAFNGHMDKAMDHLMDYSRKVPGDPRPFYAMGRIYAGQGNWKAARKKLRTAIEHDGRYFPAYYMMMVSYRQQEGGKDGWLRSLIKREEHSGRQFLEKARQVFHSPVFKKEADLFNYFTVRYF